MDNREEENVIDLRKVFIFFLRQWKIIAKTVFVCIIIAVFVYIGYPKKFRAYTIIYPAKETGSSGGGLLNLLNSSGLGGMIGGGSKSNDDDKIKTLYVSRIFADSIASKLRINEIYHTKTKESAAGIVLDFFEIKVEKSGFLKVTAELKTGWFAFLRKEEQDSIRDFTYKTLSESVNIVDGLLKNLSKKESLEKATFYKKKVQEAENDRDTAQFKLASFEKQNKTLELSQEARSQVEMLASIQADMFSQRMKIELLQQDRMNADPLVSQEQNKLSIYERKYKEFLTGNERNYVYGVDRFSNLKIQYANLYLENRLQTEIYLFLRQMYMKEVLQESNTTSIIQRLDPPVVSEFAVNKSKVFHLGIGILAGFFIGICIIVYKKIISSSKQKQESEELWKEIEFFKNDFLTFFKLKRFFK